jgi:hypothetical protein
MPKFENVSEGIPLPTGEGGPKGRVRGSAQCFLIGTPHLAFGHPLPLGEGPREQAELS